MAILSLSLSHPKFFSNPKFSSKTSIKPLILSNRNHLHLLNLSSAVFHASKSYNLSPSPSIYGDIKRKSILLLQICTYSIVLAVSSARACDVATTENTIASSATISEVEDGELKHEFEKWKSKTYELTVPLRIIALQGSIPPSWIKDFVQVQGKRLKLQTEYRTTLNSIFSELSLSFEKLQINPKSAMSADIVSIGDSWLNYAIIKGLIAPIKDAKNQDWFKNLNNKWKVYLCRNNKGNLDINGEIYAVPYRWGTMVIAYKKNKFKKHNLKPIKDWDDLWRPELANKIAMVDCPREIIGATLKYLNASYNTGDLQSEINGGRQAVLQALKQLQKQVRLFDSVHYVKSFTSTNDVWVTVGWSADVIPAAKRMSDVALIVPKSGSSIWTDLWAVPNTSKFKTNKVGGRIRGPSPLIHQWMDFCLQTSRDFPFRDFVIPGSSPLSLEQSQEENNVGLQNDGKPKLQTNLIEGIPPKEILERCEFLEPLSDKALDDYVWLVSRIQKPSFGFLTSIGDRFKANLSSLKAN